MKYRKKQLEEMARDIRDLETWQTSYTNAKILLKRGYQKIDKDKQVVLSKEEYDELIKLKEENKKLNEEIDTFNHLCNEWVKINNKHIKENQHLDAENEELKNQLENKGKEMSEKWYNEVKKLYLENIGEQVFKHNWFGVQLNRFAKQCGIEIKE